MTRVTLDAGKIQRRADALRFFFGSLTERISEHSPRSGARPVKLFDVSVAFALGALVGVPDRCDLPAVTALSNDLNDVPVTF